MSLWAIDDCGAWAAALAGYAATIAAQPGAGLVPLDTWYRQTLPGTIGRRDPPFLTHDELVRVTEWKMRRGVWRERNRRLVAANPPAAVEEASRAAFAAIPDLRRPVTLLAALAGVGPATASAMLAGVRPDLYPFFDEVVARQIPGLGPVTFSAAYYQRYAARLRERAAALAAECAGAAWTAHDVSQALWAAAGGKADPR